MFNLMAARDPLYCSLVRHSAMKVDFYVISLSLSIPFVFHSHSLMYFLGILSLHFLSYLILSYIVTIKFEI